MILDTLDNAHRYFALNPHFQAAFAWLKHNRDAAVGRYDIDGDECYVMIQSVTGRGHADPLIEAHNRYLDIHVTLQGVEQIGWKPRAECSHVKQPFNDATDAILWSESPDFYVSLTPGQFCIVFPEDAHAPCSGDGEVLKAVFKIVV
jgi:YhcH/YjgK/YiaL family protein